MPSGLRSYDAVRKWVDLLCLEPPQCRPGCVRSTLFGKSMDLLCFYKYPNGFYISKDVVVHGTMLCAEDTVAHGTDHTI